MKNVTLALPDDLLQKSREYAEKQGTSLNEFIRLLLKQAINQPEHDPVIRLIGHCQHNRLQVSTKDWKWNRNVMLI